MATPKLWRASDMLLLSDKCRSWDRWQQASGVQENELLIGGVYHMEQLKEASETGSGKWLFADDRPNSTLANLELVKDCRANVERVIFLDFEGKRWECEISTDIEVSPLGGRLVQRDEATITLRRIAPA